MALLEVALPRNEYQILRFLRHLALKHSRLHAVRNSWGGHLLAASPIKQCSMHVSPGANQSCGERLVNNVARKQLFELFAAAPYLIRR